MLINFFDEQRKKVVDAVPNYMGHKGLKDPGDPLYDVVYWQNRLADTTRPIINGTLLNSIEETMQGSGITFDPMSPEYRAALGSRVQKLSHFVNDTTDRQIKRKVRQALQDNAHLSLAKQTAAVQKVLEDYFKNQCMRNRSQLIARTEAFGAGNHGTQIGLVAGGYERKMWLTSRDAKVRDSHLIDGQVVGVHEQFIMADGRAVDYPQDFNERCIEIATFEDKNAQQFKQEDETVFLEKSSQFHGDNAYMNYIQNNKFAREYAESLTPAQVNAMEQYRGMWYDEVNSLLREGAPNSEWGDTAKFVRKNLDDDLNGKLDDNYILWRGMRTYSLEGDTKKLADAIFNGTANGVEFVDEGFVSLSFDSSVARNFASYDDEQFKSILFKIKLKKGTDVGYMSSWSDISRDYYEKELVLKRRQRFKILKIFEDGKQNRIVEIEVL